MTAVNDIHGLVAGVLEQHHVDRRTCYTELRPQAPGGHPLVLECSEPAVLEALRRRLGEMGAGAIEFVSLPEPGSGLPQAFLATNSVVDIRREPSHAAELVSQAIHGDGLTPLKRAGDWYLVRSGDGYLGWVRSWHLRATTRDELAAFRASVGHRVLDNVIQIFEDAADASLPVCDAVVGTPLRARPARRGWRRVTLADGREGYAKARALERIPRGGRLVREKLASRGMRFIGIPYLWGGTTPKGFDCSGLVQRIYSLSGIGIPRDSDQQATFGRLKATGDVDALTTGDLLFFGKTEDKITHVAMYLSNDLFLHAYGQVRVSSLDPAHPLFDARLAGIWRLTRDPATNPKSL